MPAPRRQPLSELSLSAFVIAEQRDHDNGLRSKSTNVKSPFSPNTLLSPPKRRILIAEGLASPSKSPARRLIFQSTWDTTSPSDSFNDTVAKKPSSSKGPSISASSSLQFVPSRRTSVSTSTTAISSPLKLSATTTTASLSRITRAQTRSLAPSPELPDNPIEIDECPLPPSRPVSLKRLRSAGSVTSGVSSTRSPTPKRRNITADASLTHPPNEEDEEPDNDKENVPPPKRKKKIGTLKDNYVRETLLTPRPIKQHGAGEHPTPEEIRVRRAVLEAEVDMDDFF